MHFLKWEAVKCLKEFGSNFLENNIVGKTKHEIFTSGRQTFPKLNANQVVQMKLSLLSITKESPPDIPVGQDKKCQRRSDRRTPLHAAFQRDSRCHPALEASGVTVPGANPPAPV